MDKCTDNDSISKPIDRKSLQLALDEVRKGIANEKTTKEEDND